MFFQFVKKKKEPCGFTLVVSCLFSQPEAGNFLYKMPHLYQATLRVASYKSIVASHQVRVCARFPCHVSA